MSSVSSGYEPLFENAPPIGLQRRLGLVGPHNLRVGRRALLVVLVSWLPLVLLTSARSVQVGWEPIRSLLFAVDVHARYLLAAPLFIWAEVQCAPRLYAIVRQFVKGGLVPERERDRFEAVVSSTRRLVESPTVEVVVILIACALVAAVVVARPIAEVSPWQRDGTAPMALSPAGWWHVLVSVPVLLVLFLGWIWRLLLWTRLLWRISRLNLHLIAAHSDRAAGLAFVGNSVRAFAIVALAVATIAAGKSARIVVVTGELPKQQLYFNIGLLVFVLALFTAPLLVFTPTLLETWRRGVLDYGALADRVGKVFEKKWLDREEQIDQSVLERQDFSATTDLYQIVSNVFAMRLFPLDLTDLVIFACAMLLPFVPVVLLAVPSEVLWSQIKGLLL